MGKRRPPNADLVVQAKDCYDERDYILVHRKYFDGLRDAIRTAHTHQNGTECICIYCRHNDKAADSAGEGS